MNLKQLKAKAVAAAKALTDKAKAESRGLTDEETKQFDDFMAEADRLQAQIEREEKLAAHQARLDAPAPAPRTVADGPVDIQVGEPGWKRDPRHGFKGLQDFLGGIESAARGRAPLADNLKQFRIEATAGSDEMGTYSNAYGGFFVPKTLMGELLSTPSEGDLLAGRTTEIPMQTPEVGFNARTDKSHSSSVSGGLVVYRRAEADTVSASRMQTEQVWLKASSLFGITYATDELLAASPQSLVAILRAGFADEFGSRIMYERISGTGVGQFEGLLNSPAKVQIDAETSQTAATVVLENVLKMRARCWGYGNAVWLAQLDILPQLATMTFSGGLVSTPVWMPSAREDLPDTLLGRPILYTEQCSALGTAGDIILVNPSQILDGTYMPLAEASSVHVRFIYAETAFRFEIKNDSRCWWRSALTPVNGNTRSPIVTLATRS